MLFTALSTGGAIVAGQYLGLKEHGSASHAGKQLIIASFAFSVIVMAACLILNQQLLSLIFGRVDPNVMESASIYFYLTALSYPFIAVFSSCAALFRSMGNSKAPMVNALIMNVANIIGNAIFIFGFGMSVFGAALSTLISRVIVTALMLRMLRRADMPICVPSYGIRDIDFTMIKRILKVGVPNGIENSMFQIGKIVVTSLVAVQGTTAIAANAVANSVALIQIVPGAAVGLAILSVVSRCVGAGEYEQARYYTKYLMKQAYRYMSVLSIAILVFIKPILGIYQLSDDTFNLALQVMMIHSITAILVWPLSFALPNAIRAAGDVKYTMIVSMVSMWLFRTLLSYLFVYGFGWGLIGVWVAMLVDSAFRGILFAGRWKSGKWMNKSVI
jgi:putative MATE family efflux protein